MLAKYVNIRLSHEWKFTCDNAAQITSHPIRSAVCAIMSAALNHVVVMMDVSNPLTSDHVSLGPACCVLSVSCAVGMFQCFGVPEPVRPLPGFGPRTFDTLNGFFRNLLLIFPAVHVSRPARFMEMWLLIRMNE